jgi:integrase
MGILAQPNLPIFQCGNGRPINLDNLARRIIAPVASWHGWHSFRRGLATNLHALGVDDKTIQTILRHSNIGITQNIYIKTVSEAQINAMDSLSENLDLCNVRATAGDGPVN